MSRCSLFDRGQAMARILVLIALVTTAHAAFPLASMRQSVDSGGAGVLDECPVISTDATGGFKCSNCLDETCPEHCCFHEFEGSIGSTALLCEIGGCCMRVMNDKVGHQMFVMEGLTATGRQGDGTPFCGQIEVNTQCPSCAYAFLNGIPLLCPNGYHAPARNEAYVGGTLCSAVPKSERSNVAEENEESDVSADEPSEGTVDEKTVAGGTMNEVPGKKTTTTQEPSQKGPSSEEPEEEDTTKKVDETEAPPKERKDETEKEDEKEDEEDDDDEEDDEDEGEEEDEEEDEKDEKENGKDEDNRETSSGESTQSAESSTNKGLIAGATLGSIVAVTGLCLMAMFCFRKRQRQKSAPLPFAPPQITQGFQPSMLSGKGLTQAQHPQHEPQDELNSNIGSMYSPPASNESWPESPPRVATRRRRQIISPLAPLSRPMPQTPPESEAGEPGLDPETEEVDTEMERAPSERYSDSETENVDRDIGRATTEGAGRGVGRIGQGPLSAPLSSLIPSIVPNFEDQGPGSAPR